MAKGSARTETKATLRGNTQPAQVELLNHHDHGDGGVTKSDRRTEHGTGKQFILSKLRRANVGRLILKTVFLSMEKKLDLFKACL